MSLQDHFFCSSIIHLEVEPEQEAEMPNDWKKNCSCGTPDHTKCKEHKELIFLRLPNPFPPQRAIEKPQINIQIFDYLCKLNTSQVFGD